VASQCSVEEDDNSLVFSHDEPGADQMQEVRTTRRSTTTILETVYPSVSTGQTHNLEGRLQSSFDVVALEERSIMVPSTVEIDSFVSAALVEMRGAAAELNRPVTDLASLVHDVTSDFSGTARELNKSIALELSASTSVDVNSTAP
jgi:hypothetical protein